MFQFAAKELLYSWYFIHEWLLFQYELRIFNHGSRNSSVVFDAHFLIFMIQTIGCYKKSDAGTEDLKSSSWGGKVIGIYIDESLS